MNSDRVGASTCPNCAVSIAWDGIPCVDHRLPRNVVDDMQRVTKAVDDLLDETFEHVEQARQQHRQAYKRATEHPRYTPPPRPSPEPKASYSWIADAFAATDASRHAALYRALATVLHPDAGGSENSMLALNAEYDKRRAKI